MLLSKLKRMVLVATLSLFSVVVSAAFLEVVTGYLYEKSSWKNGKQMVAWYMGRQDNPKLALKGELNSIIPHPYLLYTHAPNFEVDGYQQTNSRGYRNAEFPVAKPVDTIRILVLGGSTTFMWPYIKNPADTWVARLEAKLQAQTGRSVQVINAGLNYGTSAEALAGYVFRHRFLKPDLVIYHGGGNDVMPLFFDGYNPEYTHFRKHGNGTVPRPGEKILLQKTNVGKYLYARWLEPVASVHDTKPFWEVDPKLALQRVSTQDPEGFRRNLDYLVRLSQADGADVVLFGFLQARKENLSKNAGAFKGFEEVLVVGLDKNYDVMRNIAKAYEIAFVIPPQARFKDEWFQDNCHLTVEGEDVKAQIMFEHLRQHPLFRQKRAASASVD